LKFLEKTDFLKKKVEIFAEKRSYKSKTPFDYHGEIIDEKKVRKSDFFMKKVKIIDN